MINTLLQSITFALLSRLGSMGQYAVAFRVERNKCQDPNYSGQGLITQQVKNKLQNNEVYVSNNLIAAKANKNIQDHSEYRLKNYLKKVLNGQNQCVIYFTVSSPCLNKCISETGRSSIRNNLQALERYVGIKAFAFKKIWEYDEREEVIRRLRGIAPALPYYQCERYQAECDSL